MVLPVALLAVLFPAPTAKPVQSIEQPKADSSPLLKAGRFEDALAACDAEIASGKFTSKTVATKIRILVLMNRLNEAFRFYELNSEYSHPPPPDKAVERLFAEVCRRQHDYKTAARHYRAAGDEAKALQLQNFNGAPYETSPKDQTAQVRFLVTDPLPVVSVMANGVQANFIIDTGAADVVLDPEFAAKIGVKAISSAQGTFAGGKKADQGLGELPELRLGSMSIRNVPVTLLNTKNFSAEKFGRPIRGILGTNLFYHFLTTLDYPAGQLVLAPRGAATVGSGDVAIPFWLASDHLMVACGRLGKSPDRLFLIDTGLAGAAFTGPKSITDEAGIAVSLDHAQVGEGGGGKILASAYEIPNISLGPVEAKGLIGVYGAFPDSFEESLGFHLGGIISHQFFRPYAVTFDFDSMKIVLRKP